MGTGDRAPLTYTAAGVDTGAADLAVAKVKAMAEGTHGAQVLGGIGGFAGLWDASGFTGEPVLAASADGVGTKLLVAQALDRHDTVGIDLVAMVVDDLVVAGARPLFLLDYLAVGKLVPERVARIVSGIVRGCELAGCALLGGETAEHPDAMPPDAYDLAGFGVGLADKARLLGPERVRAGDVLLGLPASGLHANGYALARRALAGAGLGYEKYLDDLGCTVGEALLVPTRVYAADLVALTDSGVDVHAMCHVTGGGLPGNIVRSVPADLIARIDYSAWSQPAIFEVVREAGRIADIEMAHAFNLGIGMVLLLPAAEVGRAVEFLGGRGLAAVVIGEVAPATR